MNDDTRERLDRWLDEAVDAERRAPTPDSRAFLTRLRRRLDPAPVTPLRPRLAGWRPVAAVIPLLVAVVAGLLYLGSPTPDPVAPVDEAVIAHLDVLEVLDGLPSDTLDSLDPDEMLELLDHLELLESVDPSWLEDS